MDHVRALKGQSHVDGTVSALMMRDSEETCFVYAMDISIGQANYDAGSVSRLTQILSISSQYPSAFDTTSFLPLVYYSICDSVDRDRYYT